MNRCIGLCLFCSIIVSLQGRIDVEQIDETVTAKAESYFDFLKAMRQHQQGNVKEALTNYQKVINNKDLMSPYEGYIRLLFDTGQHQTIIDLFEKKGPEFTKKFENNCEIQLARAQSYLALNQEEKAHALLTVLAQANPNDPQVAYYSAASLVQKHDSKGALAFIEKCLKKEAFKNRHFLFLFLESKIHLQVKDFAKALASIDESLKRFPRFDRGWLFKAMLLEQQGRINEAINGYQHFLDIAGSDETIEKQLVQLLFMQQRFAEAAHCLKKIRSEKAEYFFDMALIELRAKQFNNALKNINKAIEKNSNFKKACLLKIEILLAQKDFQGIGSFMHEWMSKGLFDASLIRLHLLLAKAGVPIKILISSLEKGVGKGNAQLELLAALADFYVDVQDYKHALAAYKKMLSMTRDEAIKSKITYHVAYLYYATNHMKHVERLLEKALNYSDPYPQAYNLLAYFYVQHNLKLEKALELIDHAIAIQPMCYYFLDTKGCVLLRLGRREEALTLLKQASHLAPDDAIIREHLHEAQGKHEKN